LTNLTVSYRFHYGTILEPDQGTFLPTLTIKSMPDALYQRLKGRAVEHRRSLNSEILVCLEQAVAATAVDARTALQRADAVRKQIHVPRLTEARLRVAKSAGRS